MNSLTPKKLFPLLDRYTKNKQTPLKWLTGQPLTCQMVYNKTFNLKTAENFQERVLYSQRDVSTLLIYHVTYRGMMGSDAPATCSVGGLHNQ